MPFSLLIPLFFCLGWLDFAVCYSQTEFAQMAIFVSSPFDLVFVYYFFTTDRLHFSSGYCSLHFEAVQEAFSYSRGDLKVAFQAMEVFSISLHYSSLFTFNPPHSPANSVAYYLKNSLSKFY